jgi:hypothetical protein
MTRKVEPKAKMMRDKRGRYITNAALASQLNATQGKLELANKEIVRLETACERLNAEIAEHDEACNWSQQAAREQAAANAQATAKAQAATIESLTVRIQCERAESSKAIRLLSEQKEELILEHNDLYNELRDENERLRNAAAARGQPATKSQSGKEDVAGSNYTFHFGPRSGVSGWISNWDGRVELSIGG